MKLQGITYIDSVSVSHRKKFNPATDKSPSSLEFKSYQLIKSNLILNEPLSIKYKDCIQTTYVAGISIEVANDTVPHATLTLLVDNPYELENNSITRFDLQVQISLFLPPANFDLISNQIGKELSLSFLGRHDAHINLDESLWEVVELEHLEISYEFGIQQKPNWYKECLRSHTAMHLKKLTLKHSGHVGAIINELSQSAAELGIVLERFDKKVELIQEIIPELRTALREFKVDPLTNDNYSNLWAHQPDEFKKSVAAIEKAERVKLEDQYDKLWGNFEASTAISLGENNYGAASQGFEPNPEELEWIGERYLQLSPLRSKTLEKILVNSLLYAETMAFARSIKSTEKIFGVKVPSRINKNKEVDTSYAGLTKELRTSIWTTTKYLVSEFIKIVITFGVSAFITNENLTASWTITTGYTLFRWWRRIHFIRNEPEIQQSTVLHKMIQVQTLANKQTFNAQYTRTKLVQASDEGAVFSPLVFSILDRQIKLDSY